MQCIWLEEPKVVKAQSSNKINQALRDSVRASEEVYEMGRKYFTDEMTENAGMVQVKLLTS